jgi:hypothetical protein
MKGSIGSISMAAMLVASMYLSGGAPLTLRERLFPSGTVWCQYGSGVYDISDRDLSDNRSCIGQRELTRWRRTGGFLW